MRSYQAARGYFEFVEFMGWLVVIIGLIAAGGAGFLASNSLTGNPISLIPLALSVLPGVAVLGIGFFIVVYVQTGRATVDSAEYAQQALKVSRDSLELSRQMVHLAQGGTTTPTDATSVTASDLKNVSYATNADPAAPKKGLEKLMYEQERAKAAASAQQLTDAKDQEVGLVSASPVPVPVRS